MAHDEFVRSKMRSSKQLSSEIKSRWKSSKGQARGSEVPGQSGGAQFFDFVGNVVEILLPCLISDYQPWKTSSYTFVII